MVYRYSLRAGAVVRTADTTERYSDRIPASKDQMSVEPQPKTRAWYTG